MNFSNKATDFARALCVVAATLVLAAACTKVDDQLGDNLLPKNQQMTIRIDRLGGVKMFSQMQDTLKSSGLGKVYFGKTTDPTFGSRTNSFIVQFLPYALPYDGKGYGLDPIVDSLVLTLPLASVSGDYDVEQQFEVYALAWNDDPSVKPDSLSLYSTYYTFFSPAEYYDASKPLFTFTHSGKKGLDTRLIPTFEGEQYLKSLVDFDAESYPDDALFRRQFKGWYVTPTATSPTSAATYGLDLYYETAYMALYTRNHDTTDRTAIYDTLTTYFGLDDQTYSDVPFGNLSINTVELDYGGTPVEQSVVASEGGEAQTVTYIAPMGGVVTRLEFTDQLVDALRELRRQTASDGNVTTYPAIMINQAEMYVYLKDDATAELDSSMKRVGSYLNVNTLAGTPDYLYTYEYSLQQQSGYEAYVLPYDGYLDRSKGYYKMDITSYVQQLAKESEAAFSQTVYLAPAAYSFFESGQSVVQNGADEGKQIEIKLTYTLIN
ncbi:MAG: DUF4270 domain-containing protein [Rikenellaceae bacterium]|jgi:hypothetical protein|nr:DUF4270 domain-containing protein [Rikenellaceae bacterium]